MTALVVVAFYGVLSLVTLWLLRGLPDRIDVMSGLLVGVVVYVQVPLAMMLCGGLVESQAGLTSFDPYVDLDTLACLYLGWGAILLCNAVRTPRPQHLRARQQDGALFAYVLAIYVAASLIFFVLSGRGDAGHWQENLSSALKGNSLAIFLGNLANVLRTIVFGFLAYLVKGGRLRPTHALAIGAAIVAFDLMTSFNRITAMYFVILLVLVLYRWRCPLIAALALLAPAVGVLSSVYETYRGLALVYGSGLDAKATALDLVWRSQVGNPDVLKHVQTLFEADNINTFKYIVDNYGVTTPLLWGETSLVRSLTVLVPSSIWAGKPDGFNTQVGLALGGSDILALNATAFGELYGNFGFAFPLGLVALATTTHLIFRWLSTRFAFADAFGFFVALAMWRFDNAFAFVSTVFVVLLLAPFIARRARRPRRLAGPTFGRVSPDA